MRPHEVKFHSADDPASMRIGHAIRCRRCGSNVSAWLNMSNFHKVLDTKSVEQSTFEKLKKKWAEEVPADCDEARALNLIDSIHES